MNSIKERVNFFLGIEEQEEMLCDRVELTLMELLKFYFSRNFREELQRIISDHDVMLELYQEHKRFFEEIEESTEIILGGVILERTLEEVSNENIKPKPHQPLRAYKKSLENLRQLNQFYNEWSLKRHQEYKTNNCKRLVTDVLQRLEEKESVVLLKIKSPTSLGDVEPHLGEVENQKAMLVNHQILEMDYFVGLEIDGVLFKRGCTPREIYNIILDAFAYLPVTKLVVKDY